MDATLVEYKEKQRELEKLSNPIFFRAKELTERPKVIKKIISYMEECKNKLEDWIVTKPQITEEERNETLLLINITQDSVKELIEKQEQTPLTEEPAFTSNDIKYKIRTIKDRMTMLSRKRPLPKPKKNITESANDTATTNTTTGGTPLNQTDPDVVEEYTEDTENENQQNPETQNEEKKEESETNEPEL